MNRVVLTGRLTRDPEMRSLASGKNVTAYVMRLAGVEAEGGAASLRPIRARVVPPILR